MAKRRFLSGVLAAAFLMAAPPAIAQEAAAQPQPVTVKKNVDVAAMTEWRHDLHQHPETAFEEVRTAGKIQELLTSWGIEVHTNIGKTGVVGVLKGNNTDANAPSIALRADIDALPITETATLPYASEVPGKSHACGHDGHTAMLLGAAKYLAETKNFSGTVYFIFQPAEEKGSGAQAMIDDGLFSIVKADAIYGMHDWPGLKTGQIAVSEGAITSNTDEFHIKVTGKGGHAAYPADNIDVIQLGSDIVTEVHKYKDANIPAAEGAVLAVTMFQGGEAFNAMPTTVTLAGTVRTFSGVSQDKIEQAIKDISQQVAKKYGATVDVQYTRDAAAVVNAHDQTLNAQSAAADVVGAANVIPFARTMAGEDFSAFETKVPGAYVALGQWDGASPKIQLHSPNFNFNDATLGTGATYWVDLVEKQLPMKAAPVAPKVTPPRTAP